MTHPVIQFPIYGAVSLTNTLGSVTQGVKVRVVSLTIIPTYLNNVCFHMPFVLCWPRAINTQGIFHEGT